MKRKPEVSLFPKQKQHLSPVHLLHKSVMLLGYNLFSHINHSFCRPCTEHVQCEHRRLFPCDLRQWHGCDACYWAACVSWNGQPSSEQVQHYTSQRAQPESNRMETAARAVKDQPHNLWMQAAGMHHQLPKTCQEYICDWSACYTTDHPII